MNDLNIMDKAGIPVKTKRDPGKNEAGSRRNLPSTKDEARLVVVTLIFIGRFSIKRNR